MLFLIIKTNGFLLLSESEQIFCFSIGLLASRQTTANEVKTVELF